MATSASQTYIARLGFQDPDRSKDRHGLACEYLFERLIELEAGPHFTASRREALERTIESRCNRIESLDGRLAALTKQSDNRFMTPWVERDIEAAKEDRQSAQLEIQQAQAELQSINADYGIQLARRELVPAACINYPISAGRGFIVGFADVYINLGHNILGEVKITKQPAEQVLQQLNFYQAHLRDISTVYVLTDYDCADLQRLAHSSRIKVFRLGERFERWIQTRSATQPEEL